MDSRLFASYDEPARPLDDEELDPSSLGPEWEEEITRRLAKIDSGEAVMIPHSEVIDGVAERLAGSRLTRRHSSEKE